MGNTFSPIQKTRVVIRQRMPVTKALSGFTEANKYALEYIVVSNNNPTVKDLLDLANHYRSNPITQCETSDGRVLSANIFLKDVGNVVFVRNS